MILLPSDDPSEIILVDAATVKRPLLTLNGPQRLRTERLASGKGKPSPMNAVFPIVEPTESPPVSTT